MKKLLFILFAFNYILPAQTAFDKGNLTMTMGYGFPNLYQFILKDDAVTSTNGFVVPVANTDENYSYASSNGGPFFLKYDYAVSEDIGLGVVMAFSSNDLRQTYSYQVKNYDPQSGNYISMNYQDVSYVKVQILSLGFRFNYHFAKTLKTDPYIGLAAGYNYSLVTGKQSTDNPGGPQSLLSVGNPAPVYMGLTIGLRYYLGKNIGVYAEAGLDKWTVIKVGLALKLK